MTYFEQNSSSVFKNLADFGIAVIPGWMKGRHLHIQCMYTYQYKSHMYLNLYLIPDLSLLPDLLFGSHGDEGEHTQRSASTHSVHRSAQQLQQ